MVLSGRAILLGLHAASGLFPKRGCNIFAGGSRLVRPRPRKQLLRARREQPAFRSACWAAVSTVERAGGMLCAVMSCHDQVQHHQDRRRSGCPRRSSCRSRLGPVPQRSARSGPGRQCSVHGKHPSQRYAPDDRSATRRVNPGVATTGTCRPVRAGGRLTAPRGVWSQRLCDLTLVRCSSKEPRGFAAPQGTSLEILLAGWITTCGLETLTNRWPTPNPRFVKREPCVVTGFRLLSVFHAANLLCKQSDHVPRSDR